MPRESRKKKLSGRQKRARQKGPETERPWIVKEGDYIKLKVFQKCRPTCQWGVLSKTVFRRKGNFVLHCGSGLGKGGWTGYESADLAQWIMSPRGRRFNSHWHQN